MRLETKALIVVLVMVLSVGPVTFFFSGPSPINLPGDSGESSHYKYEGNFTARVLKLDPYVSFVGVAPTENKSYVESVLKTIPEITNSTVFVSLNPQGAGYQYIMRFPTNDTSLLKPIGFRAFFRLSDFFIHMEAGYPLVAGTVQLPPEINLWTSNGTKKLSVLGNMTLRVAMLYSREENDTLELYCPELVTSLNNTLIRIPNPGLCLDAEITRKQPYYGLTLSDWFGTVFDDAVMNLSVSNFSSAHFDGEYDYFNRLTEEQLKAELNASVGLTGLSVKAHYGDNVLVLFNISASSVAGIMGASPEQVEENTLVHFNDFRDAYAVLGNVSEKLGFAPRYHFQSGAFIIDSDRADADTISKIEQVLEDNALNTTRAYKSGVVSLPSQLLDYENVRFAKASAKVPLDAAEGSMWIKVVCRIAYGEIAEVSAFEPSIAP